MNTIQLSTATLRPMFSGEVIGPDDANYNNARTVKAGSIDKKPAVIIRVANTDDIKNVLKLARETGMELAVRSGGHSNAGHGTSEGGIVLDLSRMKKIDIDPENKTCWAQTGLTAGEYTTHVGVQGFATGFGDTGSVGIGGITLGGGIGYLVRKYGLTIDDVLAADIITADGSLLRTDAAHHPDLFWAIRGGGGNFGVVTRFQYRLHELKDVLGGMLVLPATPKTITDLTTITSSAPNELSAIINVMTAPPMPFLPKEVHGKLVIMVLLCYAGTDKKGESVIAQLRTIATPLADMVRRMPYPELYPAEQPGYRPIAANRTMFVDSIGETDAETIIAHLNTSTGNMAVCQIRALGGAMAAIENDATAFAHRQSEIMVNLAALYQDLTHKDVHERWVADFMHAIQQTDNGAYVNFLGDEPEERVRAAYPGNTWDRLTQIKKKYDPTNLFRLNQNILPQSP